MNHLFDNIAVQHLLPVAEKKLKKLIRLDVTCESPLELLCYVTGLTDIQLFKVKLRLRVSDFMGIKHKILPTRLGKIMEVFDKNLKYTF